MAAPGYVIRPDRTGIIPEGTDSVGTLPPSTVTYPMGTFVEDYEFDPGLVFLEGQIQTEGLDDLQTELAQTCSISS